LGLVDKINGVLSCVYTLKIILIWEYFLREDTLKALN